MSKLLNQKNINPVRSQPNQNPKQTKQENKPDEKNNLMERYFNFFVNFKYK